jgi:peptidoglycan hydrolase CwlO-like protein
MMTKYAVIFGIIFLLWAGTNVSAASTLDADRAHVAELEAEMVNSRNELATLDADIESTTKDMIRIYQEIEIHEKALAEQKQALNARIQDVYKNQDNLLLGIVVNARDFNDLWTGLAFLLRVNHSDQQLLTASKSEVDQVERLKSELASKKCVQVELKHRQEASYAALQDAYTVKKAALDKRVQDLSVWEAKMALMKNRDLTTLQ